jgi:hypothetical protein
VTTVAEDGSTGAHWARQVIATPLDSGLYHYTVDYKGAGPTPRMGCFKVAAGSTNYVQLIVHTDGTIALANIGDQTVGMRIFNESVVAAGDGWWRCSFDCYLPTALAATATLEIYLFTDDSGTWTYTGLNNGSGLEFQNLSLMRVQTLDVGPWNAQNGVWVHGPGPDFIIQEYAAGSGNIGHSVYQSISEPLPPGIYEYSIDWRPYPGDTWRKPMAVIDTWNLGAEAAIVGAYGGNWIINEGAPGSWSNVYYATVSGTGPYDLTEDNTLNDHAAYVWFGYWWPNAAGKKWRMSVEFQGIGPNPRGVMLGLWDADDWLDGIVARFLSNGNSADGYATDHAIADGWSFDKKECIALGDGFYRATIEFTTGVVGYGGFYIGLWNNANTTYQGLADGSGIRYRNAHAITIPPSSGVGVTWYYDPLIPSQSTWDVVTNVTLTGTGPVSMTENAVNGAHEIHDNTPSYHGQWPSKFTVQVDFKGIGPTPRGVSFEMWGPGGTYGLWFIVNSNGSLYQCMDMGGNLLVQSYSVTAVDSGYYRLALTLRTLADLGAGGFSIYLRLWNGSTTSYQGLNDGSGISFRNATVTNAAFEGLDAGWQYDKAEYVGEGYTRWTCRFLNNRSAPISPAIYICLNNANNADWQYTGNGSRLQFKNYTLRQVVEFGRPEMGQTWFYHMSTAGFDIGRERASALSWTPTGAAVS